MLMFEMLFFASFFIFSSSFHDVFHSSHSCFLPPGTHKDIPVFDLSRNDVEPTGISEIEFNTILDELSEVYTPVFNEIGQEFVINRLWENGQVNATAQQQGVDWVINMYGGLARHESATTDAFRIVACHEIGHHLGGSPRRNHWLWGLTWASNEGQSDYYANFVCMKKLILEGQALDLEVSSPDLSQYKEEEFEYAHSVCSESYREEAVLENEADTNFSICLRTVLGGFSLGHILGGEGSDHSLLTPDESEVSQTSDSHPRAQCRVDTYMQSSLCNIDAPDVLDESDANLNTCNRFDGFDYGLRPTCWYKPSAEPQVDNGWFFSIL